MTFLFQKPESERSNIAPVAPARATRGRSSSTNRNAPLAVFAELLPQRMCSTSPVPALVARTGG